MEVVSEKNEKDKGEAHDPSCLPHKIPKAEQDRLFPVALAAKPLWVEWHPDANGVFGPVDCTDGRSGKVCVSGTCNMLLSSVYNTCNVDKQRVLNRALLQQQQEQRNIVGDDAIKATVNRISGSVSCGLGDGRADNVVGVDGGAAVNRNTGSASIVCFVPSRALLASALVRILIAHHKCKSSLESSSTSTRPLRLDAMQLLIDNEQQAACARQSVHRPVEHCHGPSCPNVWVRQSMHRSAEHCRWPELLTNTPYSTSKLCTTPSASISTAASASTSGRVRQAGRERLGRNTSTFGLGNIESFQDFNVECRRRDRREGGSPLADASVEVKLTEAECSRCEGTRQAAYIHILICILNYIFVIRHKRDSVIKAGNRSVVICSVSRVARVRHVFWRGCLAGRDFSFFGLASLPPTPMRVSLDRRARR